MDRTAQSLHKSQDLVIGFKNKSNKKFKSKKEKQELNMSNSASMK